MNDDLQPLFPVPSCVVFGRRTAVSKPLPDKVKVLSGSLPYRDAPEEIADKRLKVVEGAAALEVANFEGGSLSSAELHQRGHCEWYPCNEDNHRYCTARQYAALQQNRHNVELGLSLPRRLRLGPIDPCPIRLGAN